jgi:hypothetical protein
VHFPELLIARNYVLLHLRLEFFNAFSIGKNSIALIRTYSWPLGVVFELFQDADQYSDIRHAKIFGINALDNAIASRLVLQEAYRDMDRSRKFIVRTLVQIGKSIELPTLRHRPLLFVFAGC